MTRGGRDEAAPLDSLALFQGHVPVSWGLHMNKHLVKVVLGIALGVIAFAVIQKSSSASPARLPRLDGSVQVVASLMQTDPPVEVAGIRVTVSGPDLPARTETLTQLGTQWEGVLQGLPVGEGNTLSAEAFDAEGNVI